MQPLITLLLQLSAKAWAALVVAVLCSGAAVVFYFSSTNAGSNSSPGNPGNPANLTVAVQAGHVPNLGLGGHQTAPLPVVPEANAGLALIPVVAAILFFSARRLRLAQPSRAAGDQNARSASEG